MEAHNLNDQLTRLFSRHKTSSSLSASWGMHQIKHILEIPIGDSNSNTKKAPPTNPQVKKKSNPLTKILSQAGTLNIKLNNGKILGMNKLSSKSHPGNAYELSYNLSPLQQMFYRQPVIIGNRIIYLSQVSSKLSIVILDLSKLLECKTKTEILNLFAQAHTYSSNETPDFPAYHSKTGDIWTMTDDGICKENTVVLPQRNNSNQEITISSLFVDKAYASAVYKSSASNDATYSLISHQNQRSLVNFVFNYNNDESFEQHAIQAIPGFGDLVICSSSWNFFFWLVDGAASSEVKRIELIKPDRSVDSQKVEDAQLVFTEDLVTITRREILVNSD